MGSFCADNKYFGGYLKKIFLLIIITFSFWSCEDKATVAQEVDTIVISPMSHVLKVAQTI
jgi:hypothetical protein